MTISYFDCLLSSLTVKERYKKFLAKYDNYSDNTFANTVVFLKLYILENVLSKGPFVTKHLNNQGVKQAPY